MLQSEFKIWTFQTVFTQHPLNHLRNGLILIYRAPSGVSQSARRELSEPVVRLVLEVESHSRGVTMLCTLLRPHPNEARHSLE